MLAVVMTVNEGSVAGGRISVGRVKDEELPVTIAGDGVGGIVR